jgi:signal transduction histidine kinase
VTPGIALELSAVDAAASAESGKAQPLLSTLPAGRAENRLALSVALVIGILFAVALPFAKLPLPQVWAFIPVYQSALVISDIVTAVLLFGQFAISRSSAILVLASGFLFTAFMAIAHALSFPGLFAAAGLIGGGGQTTAWLYFFWHGAFPLFVVGYATLGRSGPGSGVTGASARGAVLWAISGALLAAVAFTLAATAGHDALPVIMQGNDDLPAKYAVATGTWALSLIAFAVLWWRKPRSVLDLWLMVVMYAWVFDIALSAVFNAGRFSLGFYAGRVYGLLAATFVLAVLLLENGKLYSRLLGTHGRIRALNAELQAHTVQLQAANKELESFSYSVSHDLRAPLRAVDGYALMLQEDYAAQFDDEGRRLLRVVRSEAARMGRLIDDLLAFSRVGRQSVQAVTVDMDALARETAAEFAGEYPSAQIAISALPRAAGDRALLKQVWANLLGNALKYSSKHPAPRVEVGGRANGAGHEYWVKDNGAGFDPRYADKLFGVFQRLHAEEEFPGTGVGLAIVNRVVARHGGRVWGEGAVGQGARFCFVLPPPGAEG